MIVYRLTARKWASRAFSGEGAADHPGRWNPRGTRMVYCAQSRSLAILEVLAGTEDPEELSYKHFVMIEVELPDSLVASPKALPPGWHQTPAGALSRQWGLSFIEKGRSPFMRVPSSIVRAEACILMNPAHPQFAKMRVISRSAFRISPRLIKSNRA